MIRAAIFRQGPSFFAGFQARPYGPARFDSSNAEPVMEDEDGGFPGGLMRCHFYRTLVNTWHAGFGTIKQ